MDHFETERAASRAHRAVRRTAAAGLLICATALAACGGDDEPAATTAAAAPPATTAPSATTPSTPPADTTGADTTAADTTASTGGLPDNGFSSQSAANVLAAATTAAQQAYSVKIAGSAAGTMLDLTFDREKGAFGSITADGSSFEIVADDDRFYMRGDDAFYRDLGGEAMVDLIGDRWLAGPADDPQFSGIAQIADLDTILEEVLDPSGTVEKGEIILQDGQPTIPLTSGEGTLYVAATGTPLPLRIQAQDGRGDLLFSAWDEPVEIPVPGEAIDVSELRGGRGEGM